MRILVTCPPMIGMKEDFIPDLESRGYEVVCPEFTQVMSEDALCEMLPEFDGWVIGDDPASRRVVEAGISGKFKAAVRWGIGVDNVDFEAFEQYGIPVINTPGMFGKEVADIAMGYLVGLARHTFYTHTEISKGNWVKPIGTSIAGSNVGVIGFGDIGQSVVKRLKGFETNITVWDPGMRAIDDSEVVLSRWPESIDQMDYLIFTCSLTPKNHHMLNAEVIGKCKKGVRIINVARGPLIDEVALVNGLKEQHVHSVALDVFEEEPLAGNSKLREFQYSIFGSHNSSNTREAVGRTNSRAIEILLGFLAKGR